MLFIPVSCLYMYNSSSILYSWSTLSHAELFALLCWRVGGMWDRCLTSSPVEICCTSAAVEISAQIMQIQIELWSYEAQHSDLVIAHWAQIDVQFCRTHTPRHT